MLWASSRKRYACKGHDFDALSCNVRDCQFYKLLVAVQAFPPPSAPLQVKHDCVQVSCTCAYSVWLKLITARYYQQAHPFASCVAGLLLTLP